ncbi:hypothetical protein ISS21_00345 [Patescibacteria group bacterium]|nr:hypothetical protein [Patescibacteria group bacterium]
MNFKKKFLILFICFLALEFNFVFAQEGPDFSRPIGAGRYSNCTLAEGKTNVYHCICQSVEEVKDCHVGELISDPICACCGDCTLDDFLRLGTNVADIILRYLGVAALLLFVVGGIMWITSGGSSERVQKGKKIITGSIIGMVIVLFAFTLTRSLMKALEIEEYLPDEEKTQITELPKIEWRDCWKNWPMCLRPYRKNCKGLGVQSLQGRLQQLNCLAGGNEEIDGCYGPKTYAAVQDFCLANSISSDECEPGRSDSEFEDEINDSGANSCSP